MGKQANTTGRPMSKKLVPEIERKTRLYGKIDLVETSLKLLFYQIANKIYSGSTFGFMLNNTLLES